MIRDELGYRGRKKSTRSVQSMIAVISRTVYNLVKTERIKSVPGNIMLPSNNATFCSPTLKLLIRYREKKCHLLICLLD